MSDVSITRIPRGAWAVSVRIDKVLTASQAENLAVEIAGAALEAQERNSEVRQ